MSKLSTFLHQVGDFIGNAVQHAQPDQQAQLQAAAGQASAAAQAAEAALPVLAKVLVDGLLATIPGFGKYIPAFNELLDALAAEIISRKTA